MFNFGYGMPAVRSLMRFATAYQTMALSAGEVFFRRSLLIASGSMRPSDAVNMVVEKATTFAEAVGEATEAVVKGEDPVRGCIRGARTLRHADRGQRSRTARLTNAAARRAPF